MLNAFAKAFAATVPSFLPSKFQDKSKYLSPSFCPSPSKKSITPLLPKEFQCKSKYFSV